MSKWQELSREGRRRLVRWTRRFWRYPQDRQRAIVREHGAENAEQRGQHLEAALRRVHFSEDHIREALLLNRRV